MMLRRFQYALVFAMVALAVANGWLAGQAYAEDDIAKCWFYLAIGGVWGLVGIGQMAIIGYNDRTGIYDV